MAKDYGVVQCERLGGWNMEFRNIFGGMCGIARVFEWNVVEYGWNEKNGTTENPEHTEERQQMGSVGPVERVGIAEKILVECVELRGNLSGMLWKESGMRNLERTARTIPLNLMDGLARPRFCDVNELVFQVIQEADGGFCAECLTDTIVTEGDTWEELRINVKEVVRAFYFDQPEKLPATIRMHLVRDEVLALA